MTRIHNLGDNDATIWVTLMTHIDNFGDNNVTYGKLDDSDKTYWQLGWQWWQVLITSDNDGSY